MTSSFLLKATAAGMVVTLLATTAEAAAAGFSSIPATIATRDFLFSPISLWVAANAIILWLFLSSSRRAADRTTNDADDHATAASSSPTAGHDGEVAMDGIYTSSSEYEPFSDSGTAAHRRAFDDAPVSRREARAAARRADRPRVRKKLPAVAAVAAREAAGDEVLRCREETPAVALAGNEETASVSLAGDEVPRRREETLSVALLAGEEEEEDDVSMDSLWESIVQRRAARPVVVRKSESWGNEELPRLRRVADAARARRGEMRKSVSAVSNKAAVVVEAPATQQEEAVEEKVGWRRRDVLVGFTPDELLRRAESFIRRQHEHLRLQRQESEQRQLQLQRRLEASPAQLIRV